jgi:hypothetical protein
MIQGSDADAYWPESFSKFSNAWMFAASESARKGWSLMHQSSSDCFEDNLVNARGVSYFNVAALDVRHLEPSGAPGRLETYYIKIVKNVWSQDTVSLDSQGAP